MSIAFVMGSAYKDQQWKEHVYNQGYNNLDDFFVDSTWKFQEGHKLDLPNELSTLSWYDDQHIDLLYGFIDDGGNIHIGFTGKTISRDSLHLTR